MKAINDAYQILSGKNKNTSKTYDYDVSLEKYKHEKMLHFCNTIHFTERYDSEFKKFEEEISSLVLNEIGPSVGRAKNKKSVDIIINAAYETFDDLLTSQVDDFCSQYGITEQDLNRWFNLELELKKRNPKQLCTKLKEALQKIKKIKIDETVQKYVDYAGYIEVKDKIDLFKQQAMNSSVNIDIKKIIEKLQQDIDKAFENYFNNIKLIDELLELTESVDYKEIIEELKEVISKINDDDFKKRYDDLKRKIHNYNIVKEIGDLFENINEKGANALKSCKSLDETTKIYTIFSKSLELIDKIKMKKIPVTDELKDMLNKITFKDFENDINMLNSLTMEHKEEDSITKLFEKAIKQQAEEIYGYNENYDDYCIDNIYVSRYFDKLSFYIEKYGVAYEVMTGNIYSDCGTFIKEDYIPLSEFLANSQKEDIMCKVKNDVMKKYIMYKICTYRDGRSLCFVPTFNTIRIYNNIDLSSYEDHDERIKYEKYQDEEYLTKTIFEQLNKDFAVFSGSHQQFVRKHK